MTKYAMKECHDCSQVLPANEMFRRSGTAVTGRTQSTTYARERVGGAPNITKTTPIHSSATHTREFSYFLCPECAERRRLATRRFILLAIFIGIPLALLAAIFFLQPSRQTSSEQITSDQYSDNKPESDAAGPSAPAEATNEEIAQRVEGPTEEAGVQAEPPVNISTADKISPRPDQLTGAVAAALDTGKPKAIKVGQRTWLVLVSEPVETATGTCRNVSIGDQQSTWCRGNGSDWKVAH